MASIDILRKRLDQFIRKFYLFRMVKGALIWSGLSLLTFLTYLVLENWGRFSTGTRAFMFWSFVILFLAWLVLYVLVPLLRMLKLVRGMSYQDAAEILDSLDQGLKDKILNTLTLSEQDLQSSGLVAAAIEQKISLLEPYRFNTAIKWGGLRKVLPLFLVPVLILVSLMVWDSTSIMDSGRRLVNYNQDFRPPAPFSFDLEQRNYRIAKGESLEISLGLSGEDLPIDVQAIIDGLEFLPERKSRKDWSLIIESLEHSATVVFEANGYQSEKVFIEVYNRPKVGAFELEIIPPAYTALASSKEQLRGVHRFPEGSTYKLRMLNVEAVERAWFSGKEDSGTFINGLFSSKLLREEEFDLFLSNQEDTLEMYGGTRFIPIRDIAPSIRVNRLDSIDRSLWQIDLSFSDDYGLTRLERILKVGDKEFAKSLKFVGGGYRDEVNLDTVKSSEPIELYYRVWDNDKINGAKSAISRKLQLKVLDDEAMENRAYESLKSYSGAKSEKEQLMKEYDEKLDKLQESLIDQKSLSWKDKEQLNDQLKDLAAEREKRLEERKALEEKLKDLKTDSLNKEMVKDRLEEINEKEEELKRLEEELKELMDKLDMKDIKEKLQQLQKENQQQQRQEERLDKLLEDLAFQRDVLKEIDRLKSLSEELKEMSKQETSSEEIQEKKEEFKESMEKMEELAEKKDELKEQLSSSEFQESKDQAEEELNKAQEQSESGEQGESNESEEKASEKMQEMSESLSSMMMQMQSQALQMNIESLRSILENLKRFSLDVESAGLGINNLGKDDPNFRKLLVEQRKLLSSSEVIRDSLEVLAQKAPQIQEKVFTELAKMIDELDNAKASLQEQEISKASVGHQYSMMAANELALLLDNSLQNMMSMMAMQQPGNQNCEKPGGAKPKPGQMGKKASEIGSMIDKLQKGSKSGDGKEGKSSEEIGKILSEQEALRQMIKNAEKESEDAKGGNGKSKSDVLEELDRMEDLLLDRNIAEYKERFKRVESRLLEDERAEEERKQKEERKSNSGDNRGMRNGREESQEINKKPSVDSYNRRSLNLIPFYNILTNGKS